MHKIIGFYSAPDWLGWSKFAFRVFWRFFFRFRFSQINKNNFAFRKMKKIVPNSFTGAFFQVYLGWRAACAMCNFSAGTYFFLLLWRSRKRVQAVHNAAAAAGSGGDDPAERHRRRQNRAVSQSFGAISAVVTGWVWRPEDWSWEYRSSGIDPW